MLKSKIPIYLTFFLLISTFFFNTSLSEKTRWWNDGWSYREDIFLPIDTSLAEAKFQPIDVRINFKDQCWAKNEKDHSVRVLSLYNDKWYELESQIYDLNYTDKTHIKACSLVFLIPDFAVGKEKYFVYYDDNEEPISNYQDHVNVIKDHYYYEPIPGQKADFDYFRVMDEGFCIYGVGIKGLMMTELSTQVIFRQIKDQKDFSYKYWDRLTSYCFQYGKSGGNTITSREKLLSDELYIDGNLMASFCITSSTSDGNIKTAVMYKYYHSNLDNKRLCVSVKHEILKDIQLEKNQMGTFVFSSGFKTRSEANPMLNTGEILPYIHFYDENGNIKEIKVDTNPKSREEEFIISVNDDADLGEDAWFSIDEGESGKAHAIIFPFNEGIIASGENEEDGLQIIAAQKQEVDIPGLKAYSSGIDCGRNVYERESLDSSLPSNLVAEFESEFLTTESKGYPFIQKEAEIYESLIKYRPSIGGNVSKAEEEKEALYNLTVFTHFFPSFPLGSLLSVATGKNFSYTYAELYKDGKLMSSGVCSRVSLSGGLEIDVSNLTLKTIVGLFNWSEISIFKKIRFPKLEPGEYVVKIFRRVRDENLFVGVKKVILDGDKKIHVFYSRQGEIDVSILDQDGSGVPDVECRLMLDNSSFVVGKTNESGECELFAPMGKYRLMILYKGFSLSDEMTRFGLLKRHEHLNLELYPLTVIVKDKFELPPGVKIDITLTSKEMNIPTNIPPDEERNGMYSFTNLLPRNYTVRVSYEDFIDEKTVSVPVESNSISMVFSAMFTVEMDILNERGSSLKEKMMVIASRGDKSIENHAERTTSFLLPPGTYEVSVSHEGDLIASKRLDVTKDESDYILTTKKPLFPLVIESVSFSIALSLLIITLLLKKKVSIKSILRILAALSLVSALVMPWWGLQGSSAEYSAKRWSHAYIIPSHIVTITKFGEKPFGELSNIPQEFGTFLLAMIALVLSGAFLVITSIFIKNHRKIMLSILFIGLIILIASAGIYTYAMGELCKVGMGKLQGSGTLNIENPFGGDYINMKASWGLSVGFYTLCLAIFLVIASVILEFKSFKIKRK